MGILYTSNTVAHLIVITVNQLIKKKKKKRLKSKIGQILGYIDMYVKMHSENHNSPGMAFYGSIQFTFIKQDRIFLFQPILTDKR